jgi:uncharacterized protein YjbJ (UPF0337 family)
MYPDPMLSPTGDEATVVTENGQHPSTFQQTQQQVGQALGQAKDQVGQVVGQAQDQVGQALGQAQQHVGQLAGQAQDQMGQVVDQVKDQASTLGQQLQQQLGQFLDAQKEQAAHMLEDIANAADHMAEQLRSDGQTALASAVASVAVHLHTFAANLHEKALGDIVHDIEQGARSQTALLIAGGLILGLIATRVTRSTQSA